MTATANRPGLSRRSILKLGGLFGAASLGTALDARAAPPPPNPLRAPDRWGNWRAVGSPPLPGLEVIAHNRLAFGPRPGDLQAFRTLGATPDACLQTYVDQQLNPNAIDDSQCNTAWLRLASQP